MDRTERIAEGIRLQKTIHRLTWKQVASILGMSRQAFDRRLKGHPRWKYEELEKLASEWNTTIEHLAQGFSVDGGTDAA